MGTEGRMPRRHGAGGDGRAAGTRGGNPPGESGRGERLLLQADRDLALYGRLTVDTLDAIREAGFRYEAGRLLSLRELAGQGMKNRGRHPEVYRLSLGEAKSRGELGRFYASERRDSACRLAMDSALLRNCREGVLKPGCLDRVLEEAGFDRVEWILAHTIHQNRDDPHISRRNREWADTFHVPRDDPIGGSMWLSCVMHSPAEAVEAAANVVREKHCREMDRRKQRKPSIRRQLAADAPMAGGGGTTKRVAERDAR